MSSVRVPRSALCALALVLVSFVSSASVSRADSTWPAGNGDTPSSAAWQAAQAGLHARLGDRLWGMVPSGWGSELNPTADGEHHPSWQQFAGSSFASASNLTYHGGPVMQTNKTYAIYWLPSGTTYDGGYESLINQYLSDVAAASGATDNVYSPGVQYYDSSQTHIQYASTFGGSWVDTSTPIPDHCSGQYTSRGLKVTGCVNDADLQAEVSHAIAANGWSPSPTTEFFVFTPRNVGSCYDNAGTCSYMYYCAYHSDFVSGGNDVIYANQPYPDATSVGAAGSCDVGQQPNGDWADATVNLVSHEHNESITDPDGNAWYDSSGNEDGDKCAWTFGSAQGSSGALWNQTINGHHYYLQQEWSNASSSCVLGYAAPAPPAISGFAPQSGTTGTSVTISGSNLTGATAVAFNGVAASFSVSNATTVVATVPAAATSGPVSVTTPNGTASSGTFTVFPAVSGFSPSSGPVGTKVTISGSGFGGATSVTFGSAAASFTVASPTSITATAPSGGNGQITVKTPAGSATSAGSFSVTTAQTPDYTISAAPTSASVRAGGTVEYTITVTRTGGFTGSVSLSVSGVPARTTTSWSPSRTIGSSSTTATLSLNTGARTGRGTYGLTITGTSGSLSHAAQATLVVQ